MSKIDLILLITLAVSLTACGELDDPVQQDHSQRAFKKGFHPTFKQATSDTAKIQALRSEVTALAHRLSLLEYKVAPIRREQSTLYIENVNVRLQSTNAPLSSNAGDGLGNLILGPGDSDLTRASHNLILGEGHEVRGHSNLLLGVGHEVTSLHSLAIGQFHQLDGNHGSITGGEYNRLTNEGGHIG
ncbi:MAG: hypothetical protein VX475_01805, partial [Myxococcota bacterium]|nr:hypothetical protein [Myxococcota bacterium]